jgi:hypothetical protein
LDIIATIETTKTIIEMSRAAFVSIQEKRFQEFAKACKKAIEENESELKGDFKKIIESDGGSKRIYDYLTRAIESTSTYSRYALAKLYIDYSNDVSCYLPYEESILLRGLVSLDDFEVELFLNIYDYCVRTKTGFLDDPCHLLEGNRFEQSFYLDIDKLKGFEDGNGRKDRELFEMVDLVFNDLINRRLLLPRPATYGSGFSCKFNQITIKAINYLKWGKAVSESF